MATHSFRKIEYLMTSLLVLAVSFALPEKLQGTMGDAVIFPSAVRKGGSLINGFTTIGKVTNGQFTALPNEQFRGRVQWDSSTGNLSITGLKMGDSGTYEILNNDDETKDKSFQYHLTVYVPVLAPSVIVTHDEHPCKLLCTVGRGTQVTLSWYREGESLIHTPLVNAPYHLPVPVYENENYTCVANNSVSIEMTSVTLGDECAVKSQPCSDSDNTWLIVVVALTSIMMVVSLSVAAYFYFKDERHLTCRRRRCQSQGQEMTNINGLHQANGGEGVPLSPENNSQVQ
ncbi:hypothetical protein AGOR_G00100400 [Albula goreensis]|uniref:Ig-like domain-containing protein n=1 Tax=Albula goreensis TaxID=1534307 RepID=A0A8T3DLI7_9TELE|nr:hypothetical protein AGOR_G00100400 [Albula goreensis]